MAVLSALLLGCSDPTGAGALRYMTARIDQSLDPMNLRPNGRGVYDCGRWMIDEPEPDEHLVLDVYFHRPSPDFPADRPHPIYRALVQTAGGEIVYEHHFPAYRIWIEARDVPRLHRTWPSMELRSVPDPRRVDWQVFVGYVRGHSITMEDEARIVALGGRVERRFPGIRALMVTLSDQSVAALRRRPEVEYVEASTSWYDCDALLSVGETP